MDSIRSLLFILMFFFLPFDPDLYLYRNTDAKWSGDQTVIEKDARVHCVYAKLSYFKNIQQLARFGFSKYFEWNLIIICKNKV